MLCCWWCVFQLGRIEAELRVDVEQQQEAESLRQKKNKLLLQNLLYLSLSQRVTKYENTDTQNPEIKWQL